MWRTLILVSGIYVSSFAHGEQAVKPNDLVSFLNGKWDNVSFDVVDGKEVKRDAYAETMVAKDADTLTITAHGIRDGQDLTKDMRLVLRGSDITMSQGKFTAHGKREGNVYAMTGTENGKEYRFRLYTMGDKYVFQREIWNGDQVEEVDLSYLVRKK